jgi:hypothetical protein
MTGDFQIMRLQQTLHRLEQDIPLLNMRVRELSMERQESARRFAEAAIEHGRQELARLVEERETRWPWTGAPCEPAD